jgi:hypothetical protein
MRFGNFKGVGGAMLTYTLTISRTDSSKGRLWSFEAEHDNEAKLKAADYLRENLVPPETKTQLSRSDGKIQIDLPPID